MELRIRIKLGVYGDQLKLWGKRFPIFSKIYCMISSASLVKIIHFWNLNKTLIWEWIRWDSLFILCISEGGVMGSVKKHFIYSISVSLLLIGITSNIKQPLKRKHKFFGKFYILFKFLITRICSNFSRMGWGIGWGWGTIITTICFVCWVVKSCSCKG